MESGEKERDTSEVFFNALYGDHHRAVHAYLLARTGDPETALDLLQEVFLRAWRNLDTLRARGEDRYRYWIFTVAKNLVTDYYRNVASRSSATDHLAQAAQHDARTVPGVETEVEEREEQRMLHRAIRRLPDDLRTVLLLQILGDMTSAQVGEALGKPAGTVRYQTHQARKRLAEEMQLIGQGGTLEACHER